MLDDKNKPTLDALTSAPITGPLSIPKLPNLIGHPPTQPVKVGPKKTPGCKPLVLVREPQSGQFFKVHPKVEFSCCFEAGALFRLKDNLPEDDMQGNQTDEEVGEWESSHVRGTFTLFPYIYIHGVLAFWPVPDVQVNLGSPDLINWHLTAESIWEWAMIRWTCIHPTKTPCVCGTLGRDWENVKPDWLKYNLEAEFLRAIPEGNYSVRVPNASVQVPDSMNITDAVRDEVA